MNPECIYDGACYPLMRSRHKRILVTDWCVPVSFLDKKKIIMHVGLDLCFTLLNPVKRSCNRNSESVMCYDMYMFSLSSRKRGWLFMKDCIQRTWWVFFIII